MQATRELAKPARSHTSRQAIREEIQFFIFLAPWLVGFVVFTAFPLLFSIYISLNDYSLLTPPQFVGLKNYQTLFTDPLFAQSLQNTLVYAAATLALGTILSFLLALLLNQPLRAIPLFRTIFYLPSVTAGIATAILWAWIFNPQFGLLNVALSFVGIKGPEWLVSPQWAMPAIILMSLWGVGGSMIIYLAGLQSIPEQLYEAASIDGANAWAKFWNVTVPMMSPVIFFNMVVGIIGTFQVFTNIMIMTNGGPANATLVYVLYLYRNAFEYFKMGYASSLAWVLFLIIMIVTIFQFWLARHWVYYEGELTRGGR